MCLMCEYYLDTCDKPQCVAAAKTRAAADVNLREEHFTSRSGRELFLWKGYSAEPCDHIKANHGPDCTLVKKTDSEYGLVNDECNCDKQNDGTWVYY